MASPALFTHPTSLKCSLVGSLFPSIYCLARNFILLFLDALFIQTAQERPEQAAPARHCVTLVVIGCLVTRQDVGAHLGIIVAAEPFQRSADQQILSKNDVCPAHPGRGHCTAGRQQGQALIVMQLWIVTYLNKSTDCVFPFIFISQFASNALFASYVPPLSNSVDVFKSLKKASSYPTRRLLTSCQMK